MNLTKYFNDHADIIFKLFVRDKYICEIDGQFFNMVWDI